VKKFSTVALFITFCDRTYIWSLEKKMANPTEYVILLITRHKFKLLSHPRQFIITLEELQSKMCHLWSSIVILILCPMIV
jgi:hypothetical protein